MAESFGSRKRSTNYVTARAKRSKESTFAPLDTLPAVSMCK
jgi:hypothetical protein